jgi:uncharacterized membrane protein YraQ (UPF0718 family)
MNYNIITYLMCGVLFSAMVDIIIKNTSLKYYIRIDNWVRILYVLFWPIWLIILIRYLLRKK